MPQTDLSTALEVSLAADPMIEAKFEALKNLNALKIKSLMGSIDVLQKENTRLKVLGKDSRRAQMVQALRNKMREYDLIVDVLKEELKKTGEMNMDEVNDLVIRKTCGGPKRFRPLTREELEKKVSDYEKKLKRIAEGKSSGGNENANGNGNGMGNHSKVISSSRGELGRPTSQMSLNLDKLAMTGPQESATATTKVAMLGEDNKNLKKSLELKENIVVGLREEIQRLRLRNAELMAKAEDVAHKEKKIADLEDAYTTIQQRLQDTACQLEESREESLIIQESNEADTDMLRKELEQLYAQCEQLLKQNTVLLRQMGERELDDMAGARGGGSASTSTDNASEVTALNQKLDKMQKKLQASESRIKELESCKQQSDTQREELREKNEAIRDLQRNVKELSRAVRR